MSSSATLELEPRAGGFLAVRTTLAEIREHRLAWERDVTLLFDDFDALAVQIAFKTAKDQPLDAKSAPADECWRELNGKSEALARQQEATTQQLSTICEMLAQQSDLLVAYKGDQATMKSAPSDSVLQELAGKSAALAQQHEDATKQLATICSMLTQQTELLEAFKDEKSTTTGGLSEDYLEKLAGKSEALSLQQEHAMTQLSTVCDLLGRQSELLAALKDGQLTAKVAPAEKYLQELAGKSEALALNQDNTTQQLAAMCDMLSQQSELLAAVKNERSDAKTIPAEEYWQELATKSTSIARQQESTTEQLSTLCDMLAIQMEMLTALKVEQSAGKSPSAEKHLQELAGKSTALARQQETATRELSSIRETLVQQSKLLAAFKDEKLAAKPELTEEYLQELTGKSAALAQQQQDTKQQLTTVRDMLTQQSEMLAAFKDEQLAAKSVASEDYLQELAGKSAALASQQENTTKQLSTMSSMLAQQTELLTAFIGVATSRLTGAPIVSSNSKPDPVVNAVRAEFEQCQSPARR